MLAPACQNLPTAGTEVAEALTRRQVSRVFHDRLEGLNRDGADRLAEELMELCEQFRFDPAFILSVIHAESSFRPRVVSSAGAVGLMQVMPSTARFVARRYRLPYRGVASLSEPGTNLSLGIRYLDYLRTRYDGQMAHVLAAYNLGPTRYDRILSSVRHYEDQMSHRAVAKLPTVKRYVETVRQGVAKMREHASSSHPAEGLPVVVAGDSVGS